jgi:hypothetical protein
VAAADDSLQDRPAVVTGATETALADSVADGLRDAGARVERIDPEGPDVHDFLDRVGPCDLVVQIVTGLPDVEHATKTLLDALVDAGRSGSLLFVSSVDDSERGSIPALVRELAVDLGPRGVRVNAVTTAKDGPTDAPLSRSVTSDDVARIALVLLSDATAACVTGAVVPVDGGLQAQRALAPAASARPHGDLDVGRAVAWVKRLLEDAEGSGRMSATGIPAHELTEGLARMDRDFDPVAAGFPTRLFFARYALAGTEYELRGDDEWTARVVRAVRESPPSSP